MSRTETIWFRSKIDWWLALVLAAAPVATVVAALAAPADARIVAFGITLLLAGIYLGLVFPMRYGLDDSNLIVRHGLVRRRIQLGSITEVRPTHNPLSSPALSLDRLRITYGTGAFQWLMISPADKVGFMTELALRTQLTRRDDGLAR